MTGTRVEVKSDSERYMGSWYPAAIVRALKNRKYLVEYLTLKTGDETQLHREEADEILEFQHSELRPHRDWVNGQWSVDFR
ncbi:hypothetical protein CASFOL_028504 [Castilleja foliolosa]|uniref:Agenet domain-containing protein n=1 Tax=Castilleja foliolosa TaxID=1961234 RepID=A0ABD3CBF0_9LAMI